MEISQNGKAHKPSGGYPQTKMVEIFVVKSVHGFQAPPLHKHNSIDCESTKERDRLLEVKPKVEIKSLRTGHLIRQSIIGRHL